MNQRLTRKEMKQDDFATAMGRSVEYAGSHGRTIGLAIAGVLALVLAAVGISSWMGSRGVAANEALAQAVKVYRAPIEATAPKPDDANSPSFANEAARRDRAKSLFEKVRNDYGSSDAADVAAVYLADIAASQGQLDQARALWQEFLDDHEGHLLASEVRLNLYELDRREGKGEQVVTTLRGMLDQADAPLPQDVVLHELGKTLEALNRPQEALPQYRKLVDEYPQSPYRQAVQQRLNELDPSQSVGGMGMPNLSVGGGFPG